MKNDWDYLNLLISRVDWILEQELVVAADLEGLRLHHHDLFVVDERDFQIPDLKTGLAGFYFEEAASDFRALRVFMVFMAHRAMSLTMHEAT